MKYVLAVLFLSSCSSFDSGRFFQALGQTSLANPQQETPRHLNPVILNSSGQIDYTCMNNCQNAGSLYDFCKSKCSY